MNVIRVLQIDLFTTVVLLIEIVLDAKSISLEWTGYRPQRYIMFR